jgi:hypothetical protein
MDGELIWEPIVDHEDYEICVTFPHQIRRRKDGRIMKDYTSTKGYITCCLNNKVYRKHRIIANQFIPNPNNLNEVDHKNKLKNDNRIENLRWVTSQENQLNRGS